jgi:hypothetical protein
VTRKADRPAADRGLVVRVAIAATCGSVLSGAGVAFSCPDVAMRYARQVAAAGQSVIIAVPSAPVVAARR